MIKINVAKTCLVVSLFGLVLAGETVVSAASASKQLEKGIALYNENKDEKAMDYFIDVLVNGNDEEVAQANQYVDLIHNRMGGIQTPVEVDVGFKEGEVKSLASTVDESVRQAQQAAQAAAQEQAAQVQAAEKQAQEAALAKQQQAVEAVDAQQQALTDWIENQRLEAQAQAQAQREAAEKQVQAAADAAAAEVAATEAAAAQDVAAAQAAVDEVLAPTVLEEPQTQDQQDAAQALAEPEAQEQSLAQAATPARDEVLTTTSAQSASSTFADLTSPEAIEARELYTAQKIDSMTRSAMEKINAEKGVHLYMRDERPDALEVDPEIIFDKDKFRTESLPLLNNIYELLALTQGSAYVILPPGSYTDDVTLAGIRQAMALNSYLIKRGISQGKLHYNMGLVNEEPPARFANLNGLSIVFDYEAKLPTVMEKNENDEKAPLLSMAIVPLCHAIDRSLGEAFAIDFSVLETENALDNWVLQVVQHGHDGKYYIVRQLEGFAPVYHQILFNGRKGIIGPELPCGKYTLVLTATDLKGKKQTLRRRVIVKCADQKQSCSSDSCGAKPAVKQEKQEASALDYKAPRLWTKPGRTMKAVAPVKAAAQTSSSTVKKTVTTTTIVEEDNGSDPLANSVPAGQAYPSASDALPMNNPYDMPYESYAN